MGRAFSLLFATLAVVLGLDPPRASGTRSLWVTADSEMALVPAGVFLMGMDYEERQDVVDRCRDALTPFVFADQGCDPAADTGNGIAIWRGWAEEIGSATTGMDGRRVFVSRFEIDRTEVTTENFRECVRAGACDPRAVASGDTRMQRDDWPVTNVSWHDAVAFCAWQKKRLPSEAEWEKAARGTAGQRWTWGNLELPRRANLGKFDELEGRRVVQVQNMYFFVPGGAADGRDGVDLLAPPRSFPFDQSVYGVYDMTGNVAEWISDRYLATGYQDLSTIDPAGADSNIDGTRVVRGGSYLTPPFLARTYSRMHADPRARGNNIGFRCARDAASLP